MVLSEEFDDWEGWAEWYWAQVEDVHDWADGRAAMIKMLNGVFEWDIQANSVLDDIIRAVLIVVYHARGEAPQIRLFCQAASDKKLAKRLGLSQEKARKMCREGVKESLRRK